VEEKKKQRRGFAAMDPALQRRIAAMGGRASQLAGTGYQWDGESGKAAGRKGGTAPHRNRKGRGSDEGHG
jgi:general stress protein YciG